MTGPLLAVEDLLVEFETDDGGDPIVAVDGVSFEVNRGETVALVGESGSGKTVTSEAITQLFKRPPGSIPAGSIRLEGEELLGMSERELRTVRGARVSHVFQNPQGALNPVYTVGQQIREAIVIHQDVSEQEATERTIELLDRVGIPNPGSRLDDYPHEFSGGQKQRAMIAIALACEPDLLIADEPTTALDVTIQAQILELLEELQRETAMGVLFITHDLGVVAEVADRVVVLYSGKVMERGPVDDVFERPAHPYTRALLSCLPGEGGSGGIPGSLPDPRNPPDGCRFAERCEYAVDACRTGDQPALYDVGTAADHVVSCVHFGPDGDPTTVFESRTTDRKRDGETDVGS